MTTFTTGRERLSFSVDQRHPREELLFKSLVRALDHRTQHRWSCVEREGDLRVTGAPAGPGTMGGPVLHIGECGLHALALPLHAQQLETMLNRLGGIVCPVVPANAMRAPDVLQVLDLLLLQLESRLGADTAS